MSKIGRITARFKEIELGENKLKFRIMPMKNKEMLEMFELMDENNNGGIRQGITHLVYSTLKKDDESTTMEEIDNLDFKSVVDVVNTTTELSGLGKLIDFTKIANMDDLEKKTNLKKTSPNLSNAESLRQELIAEETNSE